MLCQLVLENAPIWLNFNNLAERSGTKFLHSNVKESLPGTALYVLAKAAFGSRCDDDYDHCYRRKLSKK